MGNDDIRAAVGRVQRILGRKPEAGLTDDARAVAQWQGGLRIVSRHAGGHEVVTDMPTGLGGAGDRASPGWLFRSGLASCLATTIALHAAARGIALTHLAVTAESRSDVRGLLGLTAADGSAVHPGCRDVSLQVAIAADGASAEALRSLVADSEHLAPISAVLAAGVPATVCVRIGDGSA